MVIDAFAQAIHALDPVAAKRLSTAAGWASRGDSPRRLFQQATGAVLQVARMEPALVRGDLAVGRVALYWPARHTFVGSPWVLLQREDGEWRVAGVRNDRVLAGLFLEGRVSALLSRQDLPYSEDGAAWGEAFLREERAGALCSALSVADVWDLPQLARIPTSDARRAGRPLLLDTRDPRYGEAHARLRGSLAGHRVIAVTSGRSGEGKSTLSADLAAGFAADGQRVLLVDMDLRLPRLYQRFERVTPGPGLVQVLDGLEVSDAVQASGIPRLDVLAAGMAPGVPELALASTAMVDALAEAQRLYDVVVLDMATAIQFDDPFLGLDAVDGPVASVVVVDMGRTTAPELRITRSRFAEVRRTPVGIVLNRAPERDSSMDMDTIMEMELVDARELPEVGRVAVGMRATRAADGEGRVRWVILERTPTGLREIHKSCALTLGALVDGLDTPLNPRTDIPSAPLDRPRMST